MDFEKLGTQDSSHKFCIPRFQIFRKGWVHKSLFRKKACKTIVILQVFSYKDTVMPNMKNLKDAFFRNPSPVPNRSDETAILWTQDFQDSSSVPNRLNGTGILWVPARLALISRLFHDLHLLGEAVAGIVPDPVLDLIGTRLYVISLPFLKAAEGPGSSVLSLHRDDLRVAHILLEAVAPRSRCRPSSCRKSRSSFPRPSWSRT